MILFYMFLFYLLFCFIIYHLYIIINYFDTDESKLCLNGICISCIPFINIIMLFAAIGYVMNKNNINIVNMINVHLIKYENYIKSLIRKLNEKSNS